MLATNHSCVPIRVESVALGPWLHHPLPQGPHRSICILLWAPDSWLPVQWRRGNAGIRVRGKGLNLSLCSFLPMRPTFICKTRDADFSNLGGLCTWFNETVWRCLAHSRSFTKSPLTSAHDFVIVTLCDSGSWLINHSNRQKGKNPSDRPLGYHLSVFWASFEILKEHFEIKSSYICTSHTGKYRHLKSDTAVLKSECVSTRKKCLDRLHQHPCFLASKEQLWIKLVPCFSVYGDGGAIANDVR